MAHIHIHLAPMNYSGNQILWHFQCRCDRLFYLRHFSMISKCIYLVSPYKRQQALLTTAQIGEKHANFQTINPCICFSHGKVYWVTDLHCLLCTSLLKSVFWNMKKKFFSCLNMQTYSISFNWVNQIWRRRSWPNI